MRQALLLALFFLFQEYVLGIHYPGSLAVFASGCFIAAMLWLAEEGHFE